MCADCRPVLEGHLNALDRTSDQGKALGYEIRWQSPCADAVDELLALDGCVNVAIRKLARPNPIILAVEFRQECLLIASSFLGIGDVFVDEELRALQELISLNLGRGRIFAAQELTKEELSHAAVSPPAKLFVRDPSICWLAFDKQAHLEHLCPLCEHKRVQVLEVERSDPFLRNLDDSDALFVFELENRNSSVVLDGSCSNDQQAGRVLTVLD